MSEDILDTQAEWLETDGRGGFASGTVDGLRTRRYHALLLTATTPPTGRMVLVNGFDAWGEIDSTRIYLSAQRYASGLVSPDGTEHLQSFVREPWPTWTYRLGDGITVTQELAVARGTCETLLRWTIAGSKSAAKLVLRPFISGRDYHSLHHENSGFQFVPEISGTRLTWWPYQGLPAIRAMTNGVYRHEPLWYRNFLYTEEQNRGLDAIEDLASPGTIEWDLSSGVAVLVLAAGDADTAVVESKKLRDYVKRRFERERSRRKKFATLLHRAADDYIVKRGNGKTIIAGYPWFTDWGRDTFIAMRGICLGTGRLDDARDILVAWSGTVSEGMLPNFFADGDAPPEYNTVDASLWYIVAVHDFLDAACAARMKGLRMVEARLRRAVNAILSGYFAGTRFGIHADLDGLLACGVAGAQLTWMDAKIGNWVVTPRCGKPIEVQALWLNALKIAGAFEARWNEVYERGLHAFHERFWRDDARCMFDVIDVNGERGHDDATFRPNQIMAVGGLPHPILDGARARSVVDAVEARLLTPLGLRTLPSDDPSFRPCYEGGPVERDSSYHQGTVWPWLMGPFVDAWLRVRDYAPEAVVEARNRFLAPLRAHLDTAGLGHVSEIADATAPFTPRGCPFQAWSMGELIRIEMVLDRFSNRPVEIEGGCLSSTASNGH